MIDVKDMPSLEGFMHFFEEISKIPRGSGNCAPIADYLADFAKSRGLEYYRDKTDNVIIKKTASTGYENRPTVILQGHTDMVLAKNEKCTHSLESEGVKLYRDGDLLRAVGSTLGGDDGVAVAYALAILDQNDIKHPAIEAVFTSDEEIGLLGAVALDCTRLNGRIMINVDSDLEGIFTVGCAGGVRSDIRLSGVKSELDSFTCKLSLTELHGGHSGAEINSGYLNANKLMFEWLLELSKIHALRIAELNGGNADNAIPRECHVTVTSDTDFYADALRIGMNVANKYRASEPEIKVDVSKTSAESAFTKEQTESFINMINRLPNGVMAMSEDIEGLVETSLNLGILATEDTLLRATFSVRSSKGKEKEALCARLRAIAINHGASYDEHGSYPGWEYKKDSLLRDTMCALYKEKYGKDAEVVAIHAGLECGIFSEKLSGLDCVSIGPDNYDIHTTEERLSLSSVMRVYEFLLELLEKIGE